MNAMPTHGTRAAIYRNAVTAADLRCVYIFGLAGEDVPVCRGNHWLHPHFIGTSKNPTALAAKYSQRQIWPMAMVEVFWCVGPPVATRVASEVELHLGLAGVDQAETGAWDIRRAALCETIRAVAGSIGIQLMDGTERVSKIRRIADQISSAMG